MSFYSGQRHLGQFGILPAIAAAIPMVQGMMSSQPLDTRNPYAQLTAQQSVPQYGLAVTAAVVGALALAGGVVYMAWRRR